MSRRRSTHVRHPRARHYAVAAAWWLATSYVGSYLLLDALVNH